MDRITAMQRFVRAVDTGSFTEVAREARTTQPTVSKQIAALEDALGVQLLVRSTRSLSLTEDGARYYAAAKAALDSFEAADAAARGAHAIDGVLRIGCPVSFGQTQIVPRLADFLAPHPALTVDLVMSDAYLDPVEKGVDIVVRLGDLPDSRLKARQVGCTRRVTVASPDYLAAHGRPDHPTDLERHACCLYSGLASGPQWHFRGAGGKTIAVGVRGRVSADNSAAMLEAVRAGLGIGLAPLWLAGDDLRSGRLTRLLADFEPPVLPIHIVSPPRKFAPPKVTAFVAYLVRSFKADPCLSGGTV